MGTHNQFLGTVTFLSALSCLLSSLGYADKHPHPQCIVQDYDRLQNTQEILWHFDTCPSGVIAHLHMLFPEASIPFSLPITRWQPRLDGNQWLVLEEDFLMSQVQNQLALWRPTLDINLTPETIKNLQMISRSLSQGWSPANAPDALLKQIGKYILVEGTVQSAERRHDRWFINFGPQYRTDFTVGFQGLGEEHFRAIHGSPRSLIGQQVRTMGQIESFNGPFMNLSNGWQLIEKN